NQGSAAGLESRSNASRELSASPNFIALYDSGQSQGTSTTRIGNGAGKEAVSQTNPISVSSCLAARLLSKWYVRSCPPPTGGNGTSGAKAKMRITRAGRDGAGIRGRDDSGYIDLS